MKNFVSDCVRDALCSSMPTRFEHNFFPNKTVCNVCADRTAEMVFHVLAIYFDTGLVCFV